MKIGVMRMDINDLVLSKVLLDLQEINEMLDGVYYSKLLVKCPECGSINVAVVKTTNKMVAFVCKECGKTFRKTKEKIKKTHEELSNQLFEDRTSPS